MRLLKTLRSFDTAGAAATHSIASFPYKVGISLLDLLAVPRLDIATRAVRLAPAWATRLAQHFRAHAYTLHASLPGAARGRQRVANSSACAAADFLLPRLPSAAAA